TRSTAISSSGLHMKNPKNRLGQAASAVSTDASSPGMLAISAARTTPCPSSSDAQARASSAGSSGGRTQPVAPAISSALLPPCDPNAAKNLREKKCTCASDTAKSPHGVCIGSVPVRDARSQRQLRQPRRVVHGHLLPHGLAVTAYGLPAQIQ